MKRIVAVLTAILLAMLGGVAVIGYANAADERAVAGQKAISVYVTIEAVPAGTSLSDAVADQLLQESVFPAASVPPGALTQVSPGQGELVAMSDIAPGEVVLTRRFGKQRAGATALVVPDGMVAVTVQMSDPGRVGPFLRPGSTVVVYDTFQARDALGGDMTPKGTGLGSDPDSVNATRVLLPAAEVLAVGDLTRSGRAQAPGEDGEGAPAEQEDIPTALVTVAVSPVDAQRLVHAGQTGTLYAALLGKGADAGAAVVEDRQLFNATQ